MKLKISFPDDLITESMIEQQDIPCFCKVTGDFVVSFYEPLPTVEGYMLDWVLEDLYPRVAAGGGGDYFYYHFAMISLKKIKEDLYLVKDLSFFSSCVGWKKIIANNEYTPEPTYDDLDEWLNS